MENNRLIILDTETTGLDPKQRHKIIEIGCVELVNRELTDETYHQYLQPDRDIDQGAMAVHGISNQFLQNKPRFREVAEDFLAFIKGAELIIHNAPFDIGFLDHELDLMGGKLGHISDYCAITDSLLMARQKHPGQKNSLDALCKRYKVDNRQRSQHGALLDSEILAQVYLAMTGGQLSINFAHASDNKDKDKKKVEVIRRLAKDRPKLKIITASAQELAAHQLYLQETLASELW